MFVFRLLFVTDFVVANALYVQTGCFEDVSFSAELSLAGAPCYEQAGSSSPKP